MRTPIIAGNWKMYKTVQEAVVFTKEFRRLAQGLRDVELIVAPPFTALHAVCEAARASNLAVAGQNLHWEHEGAYTGEVSGPMLSEAGAEYVIIGHSERRQLFGETDATVNRKIGAAFTAGLVPIVCVGETLAQRDAGDTLSVLDRQVTEGFDGLSGGQMAGLVIAYEPVWAIGTGRNATPEQAQECHNHLRGRLRQWFGATAADGCRILYGGSVKPDNAKELLAQPDIDGALVGGASLEPRRFLAIAQSVAQK
jgi:triosephosphate isomerase